MAGKKTRSAEDRFFDFVMPAHGKTWGTTTPGDVADRIAAYRRGEEI